MGDSKSKSYSGVQFYGSDGLEIVDISISGTSWKKKSSNSKKSSEYVAIPALIDLHATLGEPGNDLAESLESFIQAAKKGGFISVWAFSNRFRELVNKEDVLAIKSNKSVRVTPIVNAKKGTDNGDAMSNLYELAQAGSVNSYLNGIDNSGEVQRTHQYINNFNGLLIVKPYDPSFRDNTQVAETAVTTGLGFSGSPDLAEFTAVQRLIEIANYNCAPLHIPGISTKQAVEAIAAAKKRGIQITCDVSIFSLCYTDEDLKEYNSNLKLRPYLRTQEHQNALYKGIKDGTIDAIASYHKPCTIEQKECEFNFADFGAISFQTFLPMAINKVIPKIGWEKWVDLTHHNPRKIAKLDSSDKYLLISVDKEWDYNLKNNASLAQNSPLFNKQLKGKIIKTL